jgi:pyruvate/2-oxoglutarate dehydrogenase complex dihydrolipoamide acyltransferase (E2) component
MPINILMPALSPTMEEGNLAKWLVKEGDSVTSGDVLAEIETDKATMEVEAVDEGTVGKIVVPDGTAGVKVNELIAVLLEEGEDASAIDASASVPDAGAKEPAPGAASDPAPAIPANVSWRLPIRHRLHRVPMVRGSSLRRWRGALPSKMGSIWRPSAAPAHAVVSSKLMSTLPLPVGLGRQRRPNLLPPLRHKLVPRRLKACPTMLC